MPEKTERVVHVRYSGDGKRFFIGVPQRDLTKEEFDNLSPGNQRDVLASDIYEAVNPKGAGKKSGSGEDGENN